MSIEELENEALKLDPQNRARLAERLLASLDDLSENESSRLWAEEAACRNAVWNRTAGDGQAATEVFREARGHVARIVGRTSIAWRAANYAYDAYMIASARQYRCPLLTLDRGLQTAALAAGVQVMEIPA